MLKLYKEKILGVGVTLDSEDTLLEYITKVLIPSRKKSYIVTPNPEIIIYARHHPEYISILNRAEVALPDGIGLVLATKLLGKGIEKRVTGVDFMEKLCRQVSKEQVIVGFLGGRNGVAEESAKCLVKKYPGLQVGLALEEWDQSKLKEKHIDILFVAFGFPKQEEWIAKNLKDIPVTVGMSVGGAFDYISERIPRAPVWVRLTHLEWVFRLIVQPWRWRRQLALVEFGSLVLKEIFIKLRNSRNLKL